MAIAVIMVIVTSLIVTSDPEDALFLRWSTVFVVVAASFVGVSTGRSIRLVVVSDVIAGAAVVVSGVIAGAAVVVAGAFAGGAVDVAGAFAGGAVDVAGAFVVLAVVGVVAVVVVVVVVVDEVVTATCVFTQHLASMSGKTFAIVQFDWHHFNSRPRFLDHPLGGSGTACAELNLRNALGPCTSKPRHSL
jgi:hypothetical protein